MYRKAKRVVDAKPAGHMILVELLNPQETLGTKLSLGENAKLEAYQAYVLEFGPNVDKAKLGVEIGDRIALSGGFIPLPKYDQLNERQRGLLEAHTIKAVLIEDAEEDDE